MSKKSYKEIEQAIVNAVESHEPAFDEQSWEKMEALLDKEKDRRRPFIFWMWWLIPLLIGGGLISYFVLNNTDKKIKQQVVEIKTQDKSAAVEDVVVNSAPAPNADPNTDQSSSKTNTADINNVNSNKNSFISYNPVVRYSNKKGKIKSSSINRQTEEDEINSKTALRDNTKGRMKANVIAAVPSTDDENSELLTRNDIMGDVKNNLAEVGKTKEIVVIKIDTDTKHEKEIEKMIDSVVKKIGNDKKMKNKIAHLYIVASVGAEASGVKLFSADKITGRYGLGLGYRVNKNISVQTGFFVSNKKYTATGSDYKTKPGSYWNIVDIKTIDANCKVYEIPLSIVYNFRPGKKLDIFASAGLSSYIMKKEAYHFYYERYGTAHQADANYSGNKNLFSVLRLSAGIEKKISSHFSIIASPGVAIPLAGVGDGEVKLYSTDITIGLKFTPFKKK